MKAIKWLVLGAAVLLSAAACYWAPEGSGLTVSVHGKELPDQYYVNIELYNSDEIDVLYDYPQDPFYIWVTPTGNPVPINGQPYFEVATNGTEGYPVAPDITVPGIEPGVYRLRLRVYWNFSIDPMLDSEGVSEPFTVTAGETANVEVYTYYPGY